jgi:hypothetical protein
MRDNRTVLDLASLSLDPGVVSGKSSGHRSIESRISGSNLSCTRLFALKTYQHIDHWPRSILRWNQKRLTEYTPKPGIFSRLASLLPCVEPVTFFRSTTYIFRHTALRTR